MRPARLTSLQSVRFVLAGGVNTLFGLAVYLGCVAVALPPWAALLVGIIAGIAFNFATLGGYAFRDLSARRLPRFVGAYAAVYAVNLLALEALRLRIESPMWRQVLLTGPMALLSYVLMSRFVFRGRGRADEDGARDTQSGRERGGR